MRTIGVRGAPWRARVDGRGTVIPADGSAPLEWHVAGEERWFSPASESTVRQTWIGGTPVCETRLRVGGGDVVQRVWCTADHGGLTMVEFENESPASVAVALTRGDLLTAHPVQAGGPRGIDLPAGSIVLPLAHRSTTRAAISHSGVSGPLPDGIAGHRQVVSGWETACAAASRVVVPDPVLAASFVAARCTALLGDGVTDPADTVRLGDTHRDSVIGLVDHVQTRLKAEKRARVLRWDTRHLLAASARAAVILGDETAAGDIGAAWLRLADRPCEPLPPSPPEGQRVVAWTESVLAAGSPAGGSCTVLPVGVPEGWEGASLEAHGLVADPVRTLSFAVRWHATRPALLWEVTGPAGLVLEGGAGNESWHSTAASGETLLGPVGV